MPDVKEKSLAAICALDFKATLVQTEPVDSAKQERARHKCLTRILPLLESRGVELFVLESRGKALDKRDVKLLDGLKGSRIVSTIRLEHVRGSDEPRLWVADQVLGAYGDARARAGDDRWEPLADRVSVETVAP
ncbi:MAG: hypothetical protein IJ111_14285 [Eggerthellaceae bacterium]|nr:hypothetical protein [Eggerthellaceae bacterium]